MPRDRGSGRTRHAIPPFVWFFGSLGAMLLLGALAPGPDVVPDALAWAGAVLACGGLLLNAAASRAFRRQRTTIDPEGQPRVLVDAGVYRWTRNPMYLAGILILSGLFLVLGALTTAVVPPLYALIASRCFIPPEERRLEATFGEAYRSYRARVRRWV